MSENIGRYNVIFEILSEQKGEIDKIKKDAGGLAGVFNTAKGAFAGIIAANVVQGALNAIGGIVGRAKDLAATAETSAQSFKTLLGNATLAKNLLAELNKFSIETPFEPAEIEASAKTLLGFGRSAKDVRADIELIGNASAATGANLQGLATVFGQVAGIGKLGGQDALQFINQGLPIYQLLAESTGKSVTEVKKLQEQGKITFDDLRKSFEKASAQGGKFAGALADQSKTYPGLISTFRGNVDELLKSIGQTVLPIIKPIVSAIAAIFADLNTKFKELGPKISEAIEIIGPVVKPFFSFMLGAFASLGSAIITFIKILSSVPKFVQENATSLKLLGIALITFNVPLIISTTLLIKNTIATKAKAVADFFLATRTGLLTRAWWLLNAAMVANPIGVIIAGVLLLAAGFIYLYKNSETARNIFAGIANVVVKLIDAFTDLGATFKNTFKDGFILGVEKTANAVLDNVKKSIKETFTDLENIVSGEDVGASALRLAEKVLNVMTLGLSGKIKKIGKFIIDSFTKGFDGNAAKENLNFGGGEKRKGLYKGLGDLNTEQAAAAKALSDADKKAQSDRDDAKKRAAEAAAKDAEKNEIESASKIFAIRKRNALATIKDEEELSIELKKIELEKQIAIAKIKQKYSKKDGLDFIELGNQITELSNDLNKLFKRDKIDILDLLPPSDINRVKKQTEILKNEIKSLTKELNNVSDPSIKQALKEQIEGIRKEIAVFESPKISKLTLFEAGGFDAIDIESLLPEDQVAALLARLQTAQEQIKRFKEAVAEGTATPGESTIVKQYQSDADRIIEILNELGIKVKGQGKKTAEDYAKELGTILTGVANTIKGASLEVLNNEIKTTDTAIGLQEKRVESAEKNAEKGKVGQLKIEEERLSELNEKRAKYVQAQKVITSLEITQANAVAAANSIKAISAGFAAGGPAGIITGIATGIALVAQIALIISSIKNSFADIPAFKEGVESFSTKKDGRVVGPGTGTSDSVLSKLSHGERVIDAFKNSQIGNISNAQIVEAVRISREYPKLKMLPTSMISTNNNKVMENKLDELRKSFESLKIITKLDKKGFSQQIERDLDNVTRRKKYIA